MAMKTPKTPKEWADLAKLCGYDPKEGVCLHDIETGETEFLSGDDAIEYFRRKWKPRVRGQIGAIRRELEYAEEIRADALRELAAINKIVGG